MVQKSDVVVIGDIFADMVSHIIGYPKKAMEHTEHHYRDTAAEQEEMSLRGLEC